MLAGWLTSLSLKSLANPYTGGSFKGCFLQSQMPLVAELCNFPPSHFLTFPDIPKCGGPHISRQFKNRCNFIMQHHLQLLLFPRSISFSLVHKQFFNRITIKPQNKSSQIKSDKFCYSFRTQLQGVYFFLKRQFCFPHT